MASRMRRKAPRTTSRPLMTAEELLALSIPDKCTELVRGRLIVREPPGYLHGDTAARILVAMGIHLNTFGGGRVLAAESGFTLFRNPDTVRAPDVAFIRTERLPAPGFDGFVERSPDIAVEVLSPSDRAGKVREKVTDWITAGARLVWVVDPARRRARVHRCDGGEALLSAENALDGEDVLPGFRLPLSAIFD